MRARPLRGLPWSTLRLALAALAIAWQHVMPKRVERVVALRQAVHALLAARGRAARYPGLKARG